MHPYFHPGHLTSEQTRDVGIAEGTRRIQCIPQTLKIRPMWVTGRELRCVQEMLLAPMRSPVVGDQFCPDTLLVEETNFEPDCRMGSTEHVRDLVREAAQNTMPQRR